MRRGPMKNLAASVTLVLIGFHLKMPKTLKEKAKEKYSQIGEVSCPAFPDETIVFNAKGFNHIFYKGARSGRRKDSIAVRVRLLDRAAELLEISTIFQEEDSYKGVHKGKRKKYHFWAFEGVIRNRRIKVIIRQVGEGKKHFWSVIPSWRKSRFGIRNIRSNIRRQ